MNKQKYILTQRHQLIDLNKTFKNFNLTFQVISAEPNKDFQAVVMTQEQLDGIQDLNAVEMKLAKGKIGGTIVADNDKYQNYFLILKSIQPEEKLEVEVATTIEEIPPKTQTNGDSPVSNESFEKPENPVGTPTPTQPGASGVHTPNPATIGPVPGSNGAAHKKSLLRNPWLWVALLVLVAGGFYYYFYIYRPSHVPAHTPPASTGETITKDVLPTPNTVEAVVPLVPPPEPSVSGKGKKASGKNQLYRELSAIA